MNFCKENIEEENSESNSLNKIRDIKICKKLKIIHHSFLNIVKANKISKLNEEDIIVKLTK